MRIFSHLIHLCLGLWDIQIRSAHSVVRFYLAKNAILIGNSISDLEQTDKSVCYELDEVVNSFWKKPVGFLPACHLPLCQWKYCNKIIPPKVTKLRLRLFNNLRCHPQKRTK